MKVVDNGTEKRIAIYTPSSSSGLGSSAANYVGDVGFKLLDIFIEEGLLSKAAYGAAWLQVKFMKFFWDECEGMCEEYWIMEFANSHRKAQ